MWGDVAVGERPMPMEEVPPLPPQVEPPRAVENPLSEADAMMLAPVHPYGHEKPHEVSRAEFESTVRQVSCVEEDTLEDFPTEEVVESRTRAGEKFSCISGRSASRGDEVTGNVWSIRWCLSSLDPSK